MTITELKNNFRFFVGHHAGPDFGGIEIVVFLVDQHFWLGLENPRAESLPDEATLTVAAIGVEAVTDDRYAVPDNVGDHGHHRTGHFRQNRCRRWKSVRR